MLILYFLYILVCCGFAKEVRSHKVKDYCTQKCKNTKPVCGSDNKDYQSFCHLKKTACLERRTLTVKWKGNCSCPTTCPRGYKPVCGTDAGKEKTFLNECQLKKEMCKAKFGDDKLKFKKNGPCKRWQKCPDGCADIWAPVCAGNGKTYSSLCAVKLAGCMLRNSKKPLGLRKVGYCKRGDCPESCPENYKPTCGNDGKFYASECELKLTACRTKKLKELKSSRKKKCGKKCIHHCPKSGNKVCGSDSKTYDSECELRRQNCLHKKNVAIVMKQECGTLEQQMPTLEKKVALDIGSGPVSK